ncbi:MAG: 7-cyano-7-deazaguanine synthase QueC [Alphaproteobacteria bacterium]|nr:7-cyano-7-deazaguanine synthase QueC [Alphaproteobacteria bacterium]
MKKSAIVLLSGGLDSATVLAMARAECENVYALSFAYGQRHGAELEAAKRIAARGGVREHRIVSIDLAAFGGSALTDSSLPVPKERSASEMGEGIPITYVPARNMIFLSFGVAWAEVLNCYIIYIGVNALDYSGYPDCRPAFIHAFAATANLATAYTAEGQGRIRIRAPLMTLSKADIIRKGMALGVEYAETLSCYDPDAQARACGACDACQLRRKGFVEAGFADPTVYAP